MALSFASVPRYCTCADKYGNPIAHGARQQYFTELILANPEAPLKPVEALNQMGIKRTCCRDTFLNPPHYFLRSIEVGAFYNELSKLGGKTISQAPKTTEPVVKDLPEIVPTREVPEFPSVKGRSSH
jgi:DNA-directed RNA polymerase subunit N (RpoN/RPB10)